MKMKKALPFMLTRRVPPFCAMTCAKEALFTILVYKIHLKTPGNESMTTINEHTKFVSEVVVMQAENTRSEHE